MEDEQKQTTSERDRYRAIARRAFVESLVAQPNDDDELDIDFFIHLDEDLFRAKIKAVLPGARVHRRGNEIIVLRSRVNSSGEL